MLSPEANDAETGGDRLAGNHEVMCRVAKRQGLAVVDLHRALRDRGNVGSSGGTWSI